MLTNDTGRYNATLFAYGQTGAGKTYTMEGSPDANSTAGEGLSPRAIRDLFSMFDLGPNGNYSLRCSFFQIHQEQVYDLLTDSSLCNPLKVRWRPRPEGSQPSRANGEFYVEGLSMWPCSCADDSLKLFRRSVLLSEEMIVTPLLQRPQTTSCRLQGPIWEPYFQQVS